MIQQDVGDIVILVTPPISAVSGSPLSPTAIVFSEGVLAPPHFAIDVDGVVDDLLPLMCSPSPTSDERMMDPILIDALLVAQGLDTE
jgi:hypothetical protein